MCSDLYNELCAFFMYCVLVIVCVSDCGGGYINILKCSQSLQGSGPQRSSQRMTWLGHAHHWSAMATAQHITVATPRFMFAGIATPAFLCWTLA